MKTPTKTTTRRLIAGAALALSIPLAACGTDPSPSSVTSTRAASVPAPMSGVQEVQLIEGLVQSFEAKRPVAAPMSGVQEVQLIEGLAQSFDATSRRVRDGDEVVATQSNDRVCLIRSGVAVAVRQPP